MDFLKILTAKERQIYKLRLADKSLRVIGKEFGVTGERIRQIECKILRKLERAKNPGPYGKLSVRAENALREAGIKSIAEARKLEDRQLLMLRNVGKKTLNEIKPLD